MLGYVQAHWYGQQSLAWSFWFNLVAIRVLLFVVQNSLAPEDGADLRRYFEVVLLAICVFHVLLLVWQVVGVVRAAESHFSEHSNMALVWGAQLGAVLMFMLTAVYALGAFQMTMPDSEELDVLAQMDEQHAQQYQLELSSDRHTARIDGTIELGITRAVKAFLVEHAHVDTVVLTSSGGNIYEGRGLARLFSDNALNTHAESICASACTIAFSGGTIRSANGTAAFGFHQYRVDAGYTIIVTDVEKEQRRDQQLLLDAGVGQTFVDSVFAQPSESMWWPTLQELVAAEFVHRIGVE